MIRLPRELERDPIVVGREVVEPLDDVVEEVVVGFWIVDGSVSSGGSIVTDESMLTGCGFENLQSSIRSFAVGGKKPLRYENPEYQVGRRLRERSM